MASSKQIWNKELLEKSKKEWEGFKKSYNKAKPQTAFGVTQLTMTTDFADLCWNLMLVFAYGVFQQILKYLRDDGVFDSKSSNLGPLIQNSKVALNWQNYNYIWEGKEKRDKIAHEADYIKRKECWDYIEAIDIELKTWRVI